MTLKEWLKKTKTTQLAFAKMIKTDQAHVSDLANGKVSPSTPTIVLIAQVTKFKVDFKDWIPAKKRKVA